MEIILEEKGKNVVALQRKRQEQARQKNETAMARVRVNEEKLLAQKNKSIRQAYQLQSEKERKLSQDHERRSNERKQITANHQYKIQATLEQAADLLDRRRNNVLSTIEKKTQQERDR